MILMRQQQRAFREQLRIIALLRSRATTVAQCFDAMLKQELLEPQVVGGEENVRRGREGHAVRRGRHTCAAGGLTAAGPLR